MHWWYLPDSYDEYLPREVVPDQLQPDPVPAGPCKVYIRWVYDSERFNEWMNPVDYETKEAQEEQEHAAADQQQSSHAGEGRIVYFASRQKAVLMKERSLAVGLVWPQARQQQVARRQGLQLVQVARYAIFTPACLDWHPCSCC